MTQPLSHHPIQQTLSARVLQFVLLLALLIGIGISSARAEIYGSGDFILNKGPVVSDNGTWIGGTGSQSGISISNPLIPYSYSGPLIPITNDGRPHSINASAVNGRVTKSPDQAVYDFNTPVILSAIPDPGFVFEKWTRIFSSMLPQDGIGPISSPLTSAAQFSS